MKNFVNKENIALSTVRQQSAFDFQHSFVNVCISDMCLNSSQTKEGAYTFPLYIYNEPQLVGRRRQENLNPSIVKEISQKLNLPFIEDHEFPEADGKTAFSPLDLLDYIYAILQSPSYRSKYKEFLKIDFPRIPYPENADQFWQLVALGKQIREIHLLKHPVLNKLITSWNIDGDNIVEKPVYKEGRVYINKEQYFDNVPEISWNFYIGGYQPARKWLKDRKGRELSYDDLEHYQKIIIALVETDRLMKEIDQVYKV